MTHGAISGRTPGNMVAEYESKREHKRYAGDFQECPGCGGQMHKTAKLCHDCHVEHNNTFGAVSKVGDRDRRERFDLALQAGWTVAELYGGKYDPDNPKGDRLPTREQIMARMIEK